MKKKRILTACIAVACLLATPLSTFADSRSYRPPPQKGVIFVVIRAKGYDSTSIRHSTKVAIRWGSYARSTRFPSITRSRPALGMVIRLRHDNNDSVPITVDTDGQVLQLEQTSRSPSQWTDQNWEQADW